MDEFIARENIKHYRRKLENGVDEPTRLDRHISLLSEIIARHVDLTDKLQSMGGPIGRAPMVLATLNDLMAVYIGHRQTITVALADGKEREG